jgi:hypothetical protein
MAMLSTSWTGDFTMSRFDNLFNVAKGKDVSTPPDNLSGVEKLSKSKDPNYVRTTIYLPRELHRKLKTQATIDGEEMSQIIEQLVDNWVSEHSDV